MLPLEYISPLSNIFSHHHLHQQGTLQSRLFLSVASQWYNKLPNAFRVRASDSTLRTSWRVTSYIHTLLFLTWLIKVFMCFQKNRFSISHLGRCIITYLSAALAELVCLKTKYIVNNKSTTTCFNSSKIPQS